MWQDLIVAIGIVLFASILDRKRLVAFFGSFSLPRLERRHPYLEVFGLIVASLLVSWLGVVAAIGWGSLSRQLAGGNPLPTAQETQRCHAIQEMLFYELGGSSDPASALVELQQREPIFCPFRGEFSIDEEGHVTCSEHGRDEDLPPVERRALRTPSPADGERCREYQQSVYYAIHRQPDPQAAIQRFRMDCPLGGKYVIDEDGYLRCRAHGKRSDLRPIGKGGRDR